MRLLSSTSARLSPALLLVAGLSATLAHADSITLGTGTSSFAGNEVDTCYNCSYILPQAFGTAGTLASYTFNAYSFGDSNATGDITPFLLSGTLNGDGTTTFTITGVGTMQTEQNVSGNQTFDFGLTSGSDAVSADTYFGWFDTGGALATFAHDGSGAGTFLFEGSNTVGQAFTLENTSQEYNRLNALNDRIYNVNATETIAVTPEPSSLALLATGLACIVAFLRKRST